VVNEIGTVLDVLSATLGGLCPRTQADLLEFLETGSSPMLRSAQAS
jgi:hypothetical protein